MQVKGRNRSKGKMVFAVSYKRDSDRGDWMHDSGASRYLVNDDTLLINSAASSHEIAMADGESLHLMRVSSVRLKIIARGVESIVTLTDVYLAPRLDKNIILYGKLERDGFLLFMTARSVHLLGAVTET